MIDISHSNRFGREMPMIYNCDNGYELKAEGISFKGIRIHGGNTHANTQGCILVAENRLNDDTIQGTKEADVTNMIVAAHDRGEEVWIEIVEEV